ncbi:MAG: hypothetical protein ILO42_03785 [Clostridia bacterium]|nr:hypothetical protein [Clostridia bacterium]
MNNQEKRLPSPLSLPREIDGGKWSEGHVQGIALDRKNGYMYYSFTTVLVKTDLYGKLIGTVSGLTGHLGCISFNAEDGKVYGSIEYKHDAIGESIMKRTGRALAAENAFYIGIFDVEKIDRTGLDAERDGIMTAVYLSDVVDDFESRGEGGLPHRFACSGIDGTGFGPDFGAPKDSPYLLFVAYGIYGDTERDDNDNQVILGYDWRRFEEYAQPLTQDAPHHSGPSCDRKYFLYTGNTNWGIQNLEYDAFLDAYLLPVYRGKKPAFRNPPMFIADRRVPPSEQPLRGVPGKTGLCLTLKQIGTKDEANGVWGCDFDKGQTGVYAFGDGYYYFSHNGRTADAERLHTCTVKMYRADTENPILFIPV